MLLMDIIEARDVPRSIRDEIEARNRIRGKSGINQRNIDAEREANLAHDVQLKAEKRRREEIERNAERERDQVEKRLRQFSKADMFEWLKATDSPMVPPIERIVNMMQSAFYDSFPDGDPADTWYGSVVREYQKLNRDHWGDPIVSNITEYDFMAFVHAAFELQHGMSYEKWCAAMWDDIVADNPGQWDLGDNPWK